MRQQEIWRRFGQDAQRRGKVNGVALFELAQAVVAVGGIGEKCARRAAETAIEYAQPRALLSAGIAGAISPKLKVGDVGRIREVVDVATGERYPTRGGEWVLATSQDVSDAAEKQELLTKYGADVVDMEARSGSASGEGAWAGVRGGEVHFRRRRICDAAADALHRPEWKVCQWPVPALRRIAAKVVAGVGEDADQCCNRFSEPVP